MEMDLVLLVYLHDLRMQTLDYCRENGLNNLNLIMDRFIGQKQNKTFINFQEIVYNELETVTNFYTSFDFENPEANLIKIRNLIGQECKIELDQLDPPVLFKLLEDNMSRFDIMSIEWKVILSMYYFSKKYSSVKIKIIDYKNKEHVYIYFKSLIESKVNKYSGRITHILDHIYKNIKKDPNQFFLYLEIETINKIRNLGQKTYFELYPVLERAIQAVDYDLLNDPIALARNAKWLKLESELKLNSFEVIKWLKLQGHLLDDAIPFFSLFEFYLSRKWNKKEIDLFFNYVNANKSDQWNLSGKICDSYGFTRERLRQLKESLFKKYLAYAVNLNDALVRNKILMVDYLDKYGSGEIISSIDSIKYQEKTVLNENFIFKILEVIYNKHKLLIDNFKSREFKFLIPKDLFVVFNFSKMLSDIEGLKSSKLITDIKIPVRNLLTPYLNDNAKWIDYEFALPGLYNIFVSHFQLEFDNNGMIWFKRNSHILISEYIEQILRNADRPLHIKEISEVLIEQYPNREVNVRSLRSTLTANKSIFKLFGVSTYGMSDWSLPDADNKNKTITDLIISFLEKSKEPRHVYHITEYVNKFRSTSEKNINGIIRLNFRKKFKIYKGNFYGLNDIHSAEFITKIKELPGMWFKELINRYFKNGISAESMFKIIQKESKRYDTIEELIEVKIKRKINLKVLELTFDGKLKLIIK